MAEAPQIAVPTPTRVPSRAGMRSARPSHHAVAKATPSVASVTGSEASPVRAITAKSRPKPSSTMLTCSPLREAKAMPGR
jgi:hypothetical protein